METINEAGGNLRDFLTVIFKHKSKMIAIFIAIVATVTIGSFVISPTYEATSKILVKFGRENVYTATTHTQGGSPPVVFDMAREERINSEVEILTSRALVEKVIKDIGVAKLYPDIQASYAEDKKTPPLERAILAFQKKLKAEAVKKSDIITISFQHKDPVIAAEVLNKLMERLTEYHVWVHKQPQSYTFFDEQVKHQADQLRQAENAYQAFRGKHNVAALTSQKELLLKQISDIEMALAKTRGDISENEARLRALSAHESTPAGLTKFGQETDLNPYAISAIKTRLSELRIKEQELLGKWSEKNMYVVNVRREIKEAEQLLAQEEQIYNQKASTSVSQTLATLRSKEASLKRDMAKYQQELNRVNSIEMQLNELERNVKLNQENYQLYAKKMEEARISNAMDSERMVNINVAEPALPPIKPVKPNIPLNIVLAIVMGSVCALGAAFFSEYLSHTFSTREDLERHAGLNVLTAISETKA